MRRSLFLTCLMIFGVLTAAKAQPVTDECFTRTGELSNVPTVSSTEVSCEAAGAFALSAEWVTPANGLGPSFGAASGTIEFSRGLDVTGLTDFDVHVSIHLDHARAFAQTTLVGDAVQGGQAANSGLEIVIPSCTECWEYSGRLLTSIVSTAQGETVRSDEDLNLVVPVRRNGGAFTESVPMRITLSGAANGLYTPGRSEISFAGSITSITIEPPAPTALPVCEHEAYGAGSLLSQGRGSAACDADAGTFATDLVADPEIVGNDFAESRIRMTKGVTLSNPAPWAVLEVNVTIARAEYNAPAYPGPGLWPGAQSWLSIGYRTLDGARSGAEEFTVVESRSGESFPGSRTIRVLIQRPGAMLPAGVYEVELELWSSINPERRPLFPMQPLELHVAGSLDSVSLSG